MNQDVSIRCAERVDADAIARIYNQGIRERIATLETEERSADERLSWLGERNDRLPVFVAEVEGEIRGWGSLNVFNPRSAYRFVADVSIYVDRAARGMGIGSQLLDSLTASAIDHRYHKLVVSAFPWNDASMQLFRTAGFREVGVYREQGLLDGKWVDTIILEKILDNDPPRSDDHF